ncbi:hypothetical protein [Paenibacillus dendritiformis]|uniref:hypothetical protein n=1 Tax=Paenibacillus dendritiformis TaxID=130049 RepID=UPI0020C2F286|nr:hypothetical protein [Paenibacillus dendritiformis]CAH8772283.1 hypothetical protein H7S4_005022 [Paenibacillus dendritiformis]
MIYIMGRFILKRLFFVPMAIENLPDLTDRAIQWEETLDSQQQLVAWMANILSQKLPENEPHLRELIQNVKGGVSVMGLEKTLDAIKREGKQEGKREAKEEVVKQMIAQDLDPELIARVTGFPVDIIAKLREQSH